MRGDDSLETDEENEGLDGVGEGLIVLLCSNLKPQARVQQVATRKYLP